MDLDKIMIKIKILKFGIVGIINTIFSLLLYTLLVTMKINYIVSNISSYVASICLAYILNSIYVFKSRYSWIKFIKFSSGYITTMICNTIFLYLLVEYLLVDKIYSQLILTSFGLLLNYYFQNNITFKNQKNKGEK